jgi:NTE family protein
MREFRAAVCTALIAVMAGPSGLSAQAPGRDTRPLNGSQIGPPSQGTPQQGLPTAPENGNGAPNVPTGTPPGQGRKRIGLALGGGGALGLSEIGVLRWMEENQIPVDVIAGTSMGSLLAALYSTGHTPDQMSHLTSDAVFSKVFRVSADFRALNFRRREDRRFLPGGFTMGLKHGVSARNGLLLDYGLNQFLNAQFLPYGADFSFDDMPIPFRCVATDILVGREAVFTHGPLAEAVRASISIPGVFPPWEDGGHIYVDGALTENLPTDLVKNDLHADVVLAVSLPLTPPDRGDTNSVLGVLQRSFSVASWSNEVRSRELADVVIEPVAPAGVGAADYARSVDLEKAGYEAAKRMAPKLLKYRVTDEQWATYQAKVRGRSASPIRNIASVHVIAPNEMAAEGVRDTVDELAGKKLNADQVDAKLDEVRSDGRYETDYFLTRPGQVVDTEVTGPANTGHKIAGRELLHPEEKRGPGEGVGASIGDQTTGETGNAISTTPVNNTIPVGKRTADPKAKPQQFETVAPSSQGKVVIATADAPNGYKTGDGDVDLNLWVHDRPYGPPFLLIGGNVITQTGGTSRATVDAVVTQQDLGGYKSELRTKIRFGFLTQIEPEYLKRFTDSRFFVAPRLSFLRQPVYIWQNQSKVAERQSMATGGGVDMGFAKSSFTEWRAGYQIVSQRWDTTTGSDGLPNFTTTAQTARVLFRYNGQDRAMVPLRGLRADASVGMMHIGANVNVPRVEGQAAYFRDIGKGNTLALGFEGGTMANRNVSDPFRFTLGGPMRLAASAFDEYRGTDFVLIRPTYFRRIAELPTPLGQSIYVTGGYEFGRMWAPGMPTLTRQDVFFGLAAETPLGVLTLGPAFGTDDHRKLIFTLGRFF